jgi:hypothetical protein
MMRNLVADCLLVLMLVGLASEAGCGSAPAAAVRGKVALDGAPLDDATITFVPLGGDSRGAAWTTIKNGQYAVGPAGGLGTGPFRVEIRALRSVPGAAPTDPTLPAPSREAVPARYNSKSELTVDIHPGENTADFDLKTK